MPTRLALQLATIPAAGPAPAPIRPATPVDRLVSALAATQAVAVPVATLAGRLGIAPETAAAHARHAELAGLVDRWPRAPGGPAVALTPLAAARLGRALVPGRAAWMRARAGKAPAAI